MLTNLFLWIKEHFFELTKLYLAKRKIIPVTSFRISRYKYQNIQHFLIEN